jgi:hypothetical protein
MAEVWYCCQKGHKAKLEKATVLAHSCEECGNPMTPTDTRGKGGNTKRHPVPYQGKPNRSKPAGKKGRRKPPLKKISHK